MLPTKVLGLLNQQKLKRGQMNSGKALLGFMVHREGVKTSDRCPCSLPREATVPLNGMRVGADQWVGVVQVVCPHPWLCHAQGSCVIPYFCSLHLRSGNLILVFLYPFVHNMPQLCMSAVIFSLLQFVCILLLKQTFVQM